MESREKLFDLISENRIKELKAALSFFSSDIDRLSSPIYLGNYSIESPNVSGTPTHLIRNVISGDLPQPEMDKAYRNGSSNNPLMALLKWAPGSEILREEDESMNVFYPEKGIILGTNNIIESSNWDTTTPHSGHSHTVRREIYFIPKESVYLATTIEKNFSSESGYLGFKTEEHKCTDLYVGAPHMNFGTLDTASFVNLASAYLENTEVQNETNFRDFFLSNRKKEALRQRVD